MEVLGLMARRSPMPDASIDEDVVLDGRAIRARTYRVGSGELMRWWSATLRQGFGSWYTLRREHLAYRPDRVGG